LGIGYWHFRRRFIPALARDNHDELKAFIRMYESTRGRRLVGVRLEDHPLIVAREGVRPAPPQILKSFTFEELGR
jgi:hypothetical protein